MVLRATEYKCEVSLLHGWVLGRVGKANTQDPRFSRPTVATMQPQSPLLTMGRSLVMSNKMPRNKTSQSRDAVTEDQTNNHDEFAPQAPRSRVRD